jgi:dipeptidyl-peptidase-4
MATALALQDVKQPSWEPGTNTLYQVVKTGNGDAWIATSFPKASVDTVLRLKDLNKATDNDKRKSLPSLKWLDKGLVYFIDANEVFEGVATGDGYKWRSWVKLPADAENITIDKSRNIAYTVKNNLWLYTRDKKTIELTKDQENVINGQSVHRNEFGIDGGIFFSPQGNYLAYYHMDQTMVADYPIINWLETPATIKMDKYPMAGGKSHEVTLRVYNPTTGKTTTVLTEGDKEQYLTCVTWSPDEKYVYIAVLNRAQNHMWLNQYDIYTGQKTKTLFEETSDKYVEPLNELKFIPGSNDKFVWWSQRDGYMHFYLYNTEGKLLKQLTKGEWIVNELLGVSKSKEEFIITASKESPLEKHSYTVNWNSGSMKRIDEESGFHNAIPNEDGTYFLDMYSAAGIPKRSVVRGIHNNYENVLVDAKNTLANYDRPVVNNITLTANDGTPLYGKLMLPTNFDRTKKYPVIVYLYNGPHVQLIKNSFPESGNLWYEYMAQRGYVVFTMDGRGSSNRGRDFEQAVFRQLGTVEMADQMKGVEYLKTLPYVDAERMGMHGWSFGGFMTTSFMLRNPGVFKCGVAGGPVMDWSMYEVMYTERYMDTPQENPDGYAANNLLTKVKNLKGKLLLIHGTDDNTVVWQHSINFLKKCVDENVQVDYFVYPGYEHNVRGKDRVHLMQKVTDYFDLYLKD